MRAGKSPKQYGDSGSSERVPLPWELSCKNRPADVPRREGLVGHGLPARWRTVRLIMLHRVWRYILIAAILPLLVLATHAGVAAYFLRKNSPQAVQQAMAWEPWNPVYAATLGNLLHLYGDSADPQAVTRLYQRALQLSPYDATYCMNVAQAHEWAGRADLAAQYFSQAQRLFPNSPDVNWKAANFFVRRGRSEEALPALQRVLAAGTLAPNPIFSLLAGARIAESTVADRVLPRDPSAYVAYLNFLVDRGDWGGAQLLWPRLLALPEPPSARTPLSVEQAFHYLDALIRAQDVDTALSAWSALHKKFPDRVPQPPSETNLVSNGDFQGDIVNGGFDWRILPRPGALVSQETARGPGGGGRELRIEFDGTQNPAYDAVLQFVPVKPNRNYQFFSRMRADALTTDSGVSLQVVDAYDMNKQLGATEALTGSTAWSEHTFRFTTGPHTRLLVVRVLRMPSQKFDRKISGSFALSEVRLVSAE